MAQKSIVDRVLMLAAGICAAALVWQLTVLLTTKSRTMPSATPVVAQSAATAPPQPAASAQPPAAPASAAATQQTSAIRVVYAGTEPAAKTSLKASDPPADPVEPAAAPPAASLPAASLAAASPAAYPPAAATGTPPQMAGIGPPDAASPVSSASETSRSSPDAGEADETASTLPPPGSAATLASAEPPAAGEPAPTDRSAAAAPTVGAIDLNHASTEALNHLKGAGHIGQAIVAHRPYRSVEDLVKKRVLRRNVYEQIKQQVVAQ